VFWLYSAAMTISRPFAPVLERLKSVGLDRPSELALARLLFEAGDRHVTAEQLHGEAQAAKVRLSLATVYNTLHNSRPTGFCAGWWSSPDGRISIPTRQIIIISSSSCRAVSKTSGRPVELAGYLQHLSDAGKPCRRHREGRSERIMTGESQHRNRFELF